MHLVVSMHDALYWRLLFHARICVRHIPLDAMDSALTQHTHRLEETAHGIGRASSQGTDAEINEIDGLVGAGLLAIVQLHEGHVQVRKDTSGSVEELAAMKAQYENGLLSLQNKRYTIKLLVAACVAGYWYSRLLTAEWRKCFIRE